MDQAAGEAEQKLRPSVETRGIHHCTDGRPPSRIRRLGQNQREKGLSFSPSCLTEMFGHAFFFFPWHTCFPSRLFFSYSSDLPSAALRV